MQWVSGATTATLWYISGVFGNMPDTSAGQISLRQRSRHKRHNNGVFHDTGRQGSLHRQDAYQRRSRRRFAQRRRAAGRQALATGKRPCRDQSRATLCGRMVGLLHRRHWSKRRESATSSFLRDLSVAAEIDLGSTDGAYLLQARLKVNIPGIERELATAACRRGASDLPLFEGDARQHQRRADGRLKR